MIGTTNSTKVSGGVYVLNVNKTGTLNRTGTWISGFSNSSYLTLASRLDDSVLNLDTTNYNKDFGAAIATADSWEMVWKVKNKLTSINHEEYGALFYTKGAKSSGIVLYTDGKITFEASHSSNLDICTITVLNAIPVDNNYYSFKLEFTGDAYNLYLKDNNEWILKGSISSQLKISSDANWLIGKFPTSSFNDFFIGDIDLSESYIKVNGQHYWKGTELWK